MPSLSSYTPFESLLFFQSLATLKSRPDSFAPVSELLQNNPFIQQDVKYDATRLSPQALEELYSTLLAEGFRSSDDEASDHSQSAQEAANLKKRKRAQTLHHGVAKSHSAAMPDLVDRLYARYKERVTKEIRREEQRYSEIKDEIRRLEAGEDLQQPSASAAAGSSVPAADGPSKVGVVQEKILGRIPQEGVQLAAAGTTQTPVTTAPLQVTRPVQPTTGPTPPASIPQEAPASNAPISKQPLLNNQVPPTTQTPPPASTTGTNIYANIQPFPPPTTTTATTTPQQTYQNTTQPAPLTRAPPNQPPPNTTWNKTPSQLPPKNVPQTVKFQPLLTPQTIPQSSYGHGSPRTTPKPNNQARNKPTPTQKPVPPTIDKSNIPQNPPLSAPPAISASAGGISTPTPATAAVQPTVTPDAAALDKLKTQLPSFAQSLGRRPPRPSLITSSGNTPWKIPGPISLPGEPGSPERPRSADISPISERALSPSRQEDVDQWSGQTARRKLDLGTARGAGSRGGPLATPRRTGKDGVETPSPTTLPSARPRTRGQSIASRGEETSRNIKNELPSTPIGILGEDLETAHYRTKRKRSP
ncbi:hypothetical protein FQN49_001618, partial [Arthroderma sp. PD_2]